MLSAVYYDYVLLVTIQVLYEHPFTTIMTLKGASLRCTYLILGLLSTVQALDLSSFAGQAKNRLLMENVAGQETTPQALEMLLTANENPPDYTCTATKPCDLGCCGPL